VSSVEFGGYEVTFQDHCQGPNAEQYRGTTLPNQGGRSHYWYLSGYVYPFSRDQQAT
jgi:hypothetical protein